MISIAHEGKCIEFDFLENARYNADREFPSNETSNYWRPRNINIIEIVEGEINRPLSWRILIGNTNMAGAFACTKLIRVLIKTTFIPEYKLENKAEDVVLHVAFDSFVDLAVVGRMAGKSSMNVPHGFSLEQALCQ
ncbi:hypothetical protein Droror1_Dr00021005 [Drosera rotundifolia]